MAEKFFWADAIADKIIKEKGNKSQYVCASGITPSGTIHIGNFREVITTELVVKALRDKGKKVKFIYSWDDYDRFRKVPSGIPKEYEKYIGMPLSDIPSPFNEKKNYAEYFEKEFADALNIVGIKPEFINQGEMNKKCKYARLIKIALENNETIKKILNKYRKEPLSEDWYPIQIYSENTGKDDTKIKKINGYKITYEDSTGAEETFDYRKKGLVNMRWRVDWPARWKYERVDFEPGGIDHSVYGGSYMTSKEIVKKVFNYEAPLYQIYEWVRIKGGREFSSSAGNAISLQDVLEIYEPEVLRYLFVSTRPNKGFQISFDNDVIKIYDDYDALENKYYQGIANQQEKRIYELSQVQHKKPPKKRQEKESFRHLITLVQIGKTGELNEESRKRAEKVKAWLEKHAGEDMKFEVQEKINVRLGEKQRQALKTLKESLSVRDFTEEELFNEFYKICNGIGISGKEFFQGAYSVILNKTRGPRLANLILSVGKERIIKLLEQIK